MSDAITIFDIRENRIIKQKPPDESGGCVIETKTNDYPSCDGKEIFTLIEYEFFA